MSTIMHDGLRQIDIKADGGMRIDEEERELEKQKLRFGARIAELAEVGDEVVEGRFASAFADFFVDLEEGADAGET